MRTHTRYALSYVTAALLLVLALPGAADTQPNNFRQQAEAVEPGSVKGHVGDDDPKDYYSFEIAAGSVIRVSMGDVDGGEGVFVWLMDHAGAGVEDFSLPDDAETIYLTNAELGARTWYLEVSGEGPYSILLDVEPQGDAGLKGDAPKNHRKGITIGPGTIRGMLDWGDQWDSYRFQVAPGQTIRVRFTANFERFDREMNSIDLKLQNAEGSMIEKIMSAGEPATCEHGPLQTDRPETWSLTVGTAGDYTIDLGIIGADGIALEPVIGVHEVEHVEDQQGVEPVEGEEDTASDVPPPEAREQVARYG